MKLLGWCECCRRVKVVTVRGSDLAKSFGAGLFVGTCRDCDEKAVKR